MENKIRDERLVTLVTKEELKIIQELAWKNHQTVSTYLRDRALQKEKSEKKAG